MKIYLILLVKLFILLVSVKNEENVTASNPQNGYPAGVLLSVKNKENVTTSNPQNGNATGTPDSLVNASSIMKSELRTSDIVHLKVFYETLCPDCKGFFTKQLEPAFKKLGSRLEIQLFPYGKATTSSHDGRFTFTCQHGPAECYGNKLNACALDQLDAKVALLFNTCMMEKNQAGRGSDDTAADACGKTLNIDSTKIKDCAKAVHGSVLLSTYGDRTKEQNLMWVPRVLINEEPTDGQNLMREVCAKYSLVTLLIISVFTHSDVFAGYYNNSPNQWNRFQPGNAVQVLVYYESLCPSCRSFDSTQLVPLIKTIGPYMNVRTIPYGHAKTFIGNDGRITFECQHGPAECYGNKLHACAIDLLGNMTTAILFNTCMMDQSQQGKGSDDAAADNCGQLMQIDSSSIKQCAKSSRGDVLLKNYGEITKQAQLKFVPTILVNGKQVEDTNFMRDVYSALKN